MINGKLLYPIGSIYMSINSKNPGLIFGGTWERIAKGKTLVGVDENDADFNVSEKTGGEKTHTLTTQEMPSHAHGSVSIYYGAAGGGNHYFINSDGVTNASTARNVGYTSYTGGGQAHNNMQPFFTCYIFVRTA